MSGPRAPFRCRVGVQQLCQKYFLVYLSVRADRRKASNWCVRLRMLYHAKVRDKDDK
jgi:hypothetical protein